MAKKKSSKKSKSKNKLNFISGIFGVKKKYLLPFVLLGIIIFLAGMFIEDEFGVLREEMRKKYDVDVIMFSDVEEYIFPITVDNIGDKKLTDIWVNIKSCDMNHSKPYFVGDLNPDQEYEIPFKDDTTLQEYIKQDCIQGDINLTKYEVVITPYRDIRNGEIYAPTLNLTRDICGYCLWDINIASNEYNKTFREEVYSTIQLSVYIEGHNLNFSEEYFKPMSPIRMVVFDERILKLLR